MGVAQAERTATPKSPRLISTHISGLLDKVFHPHRVCQRFSNQDESKKNKILSMAGPEVFFVETASG